MSRIYGTLCGLLGIPGGPLVVHLDHIENHWFTQNLRELTLSLKNSRFRILQSSVAGKSPAKMCFPTKQSQQQPHRCYFAEERIFSKNLLSYCSALLSNKRTSGFVVRPNSLHVMQFYSSLHPLSSWHFLIHHGHAGLRKSVADLGSQPFNGLTCLLRIITHEAKSQTASD